uniref:Uncharacterized protein n=2 Tax=Ciona intestinalis TaxID=7719 RepID=F6VD01_CIOIN
METNVSVMQGEESFISPYNSPEKPDISRSLDGAGEPILSPGYSNVIEDIYEHGEGASTNGIDNHNDHFAAGDQIDIENITIHKPLNNHEVPDHSAGDTSIAVLPDEKVQPSLTTATEVIDNHTVNTATLDTEVPDHSAGDNSPAVLPDEKVQSSLNTAAEVIDNHTVNTANGNLPNNSTENTFIVMSSSENKENVENSEQSIEDMIASSPREMFEDMSSSEMMSVSQKMEVEFKEMLLQEKMLKKRSSDAGVEGKGATKQGCNIQVTTTTNETRKKAKDPK